MEPPPKPPGTKAPPPRPIKSVSNSNLSNLPLSLGLGGEPFPPTSRNNVAITNAQSETHLAILNQTNYRQQQFEDPPPLPPHRNPPAIPKQAPIIKPAVSYSIFNVIWLLLNNSWFRHPQPLLRHPLQEPLLRWIDNHK